MRTRKIDIDRLFHALGDPTRRAMLDRLSRGPLSVSALAAPLGITLTAVAQHLQILEECGLAHTEKLGPGADVPDRIGRASTRWNSGSATTAPSGSAASTASEICSARTIRPDRG